MAVSETFDLDNLDDFVDDVKQVHKRMCEGLAIDFYSGVIARTPVYSGDLRASWKISHTSPDLGVVKGGSPESPLAPPEIPVTIPGLSIFPVIHVTNNTPYAEAVNDGSPTNAPVHMVELALLDLKG